MKKKRLFFERLYEEYEQKIYQVAFSILHNEEQSEDATQDVFEELYICIDKIINFEAIDLKKFILRISKNKAIDMYRKNKTQIKYFNDFKEQKVEEYSESNVEEKLEELITKDQFKEIVTLLSKKSAKSFIYVVYYGLTLKEVALILDEKEETIKKRVQRAKEKLKNVMGGYLSE
ncbi:MULTISPECIES: RNA polymerase sigma factor [Vagococcus]|uniref:RNA polymerase sigma-70 factor, ECF subfamily n=1 Tax=Vagococcus fluvialis bH819 TaxID=1255619 RepID=A0A1X6WPL2_9ENTE|nr:MULTISPECIES: RNA polymerase sigma factor [Vagococcus]SLM86172.1 RNA polymerase sigma-70 factor, ECF subfamily [Vagococcus fluvialis bH819]